MSKSQELKYYFAKTTNPAIVLRKILAGHNSRVSISKASGLDRAAVTRSVAGLAEVRLVTEGNSAKNGGQGRPRRNLEILNQKNWIVSIHIGYHTITVGAVGIGGVVFDRTVAKHDQSADSVLSVCLKGIEQQITQQPYAPLGVGVTIGGRVSTQSQVILSMPDFNWHNLDLRAKLIDATGLPVVLSPIALAYAQANLMYGLVDSSDTFGHLYIGSIVEYALIQKGESWCGNGIATGILEHLPVKSLRGEYGTVRELVSDEGITALAKQRGLIEETFDFEEILRIVRNSKDNTLQTSQLQQLLDWRAENVAALIQQLNEVVPVPKIVLSASITRQPDGVATVRKAIQDNWSCPSRPQIISDEKISRSGMLAPTAAFIGKLIA